MVSRELTATNVDMNVGMVKEVVSKLLDFPGPGGGPHEHLSVRPDLLNDLPDLRLKAHVQHAVGLIKHQVGGPSQVDLPDLQEVNQTTRSCDNYFSP